MDTIRFVLIIAAAIVVAILALKVVFFVTSVLVSLLVTVAIVAAVGYVLYLLARSALRKRTTT